MNMKIIKKKLQLFSSPIWAGGQRAKPLMAAAAAPGENPRRWRYTWEALAHIATLRLYLFSSAINPSIHCRALTAALRPGKSLLVVRWSEGGRDDGDVILRVPVPRVLIDPSCPVDCRAREDHIEVKLVLLLPVDHPVVARLRGVLDPDGEGAEGEEEEEEEKERVLDSDLKRLATGGVDIFCKACSTKLTRQPLRRFVEMPSVDWPEIADNWFGACCCSFGGISEKLVFEYVNAYKCVGGTCLLNTASVVVCKDDLEGYTFQNCLAEYSENCGNSGVTNVATEGSCENSKKCIPDICTNDTDSSCPDQHVLRDTKCACDVDFSKLDFNHCSGDVEKPYTDSSADHSSSINQDHCCSDNRMAHASDAQGRSEVASVTHKWAHLSGSSMPFKGQICLRNSSLGSGFMLKTSNLANDVEWVEFLCCHCLSPIGSYPSLKNACDPLDDGIRLFKCYVSTNASIGGPKDIFRKYSLQRLFVNLLLESTIEELSFRTVVRDLRTKNPMLQIVHLNSNAWCSTGYCLENQATQNPLEADLKPLVKVLFSDCSTTTKTNSQMIDDWSARNHAEDVYMLMSQIQEVIQCLNLGLDRLPPSCSTLQGLFVSFLER